MTERCPRRMGDHALFLDLERGANDLRLFAFAKDDTLGVVLGFGDDRPDDFTTFVLPRFQLVAVPAISIGRRAAPLSIAARATAGASHNNTRGSTGCGRCIREPKRSDSRS